MLAHWFALVGSSTESATITLGIVISTSAPSAHPWVISNSHTRPRRMSLTVPGL